MNLCRNQMMQAVTVLGAVILFTVYSAGADKIVLKRKQVTLLQHQPSSAKGIQFLQTPGVSGNPWFQLLTTIGKESVDNFTKAGVKTFPCGDGYCDGCGTCCSNDPVSKCCPQQNSVCCNNGGCCRSDYPLCCGQKCYHSGSVCCSPSQGTACAQDHPVCCPNDSCCVPGTVTCCSNNYCAKSGYKCCPPPIPGTCPDSYPVCCSNGKYCCTNSHPICCTDGCAPAGYSCCSGGGSCPSGWHCCNNGYCCYGETDGTGQPQSESSKLSIASQLKYSLESCASGAHCCPAGFLCCQNNCVQVPISTPCSGSQLGMTYPGVILQDLNFAVKWLIKVEGLATKGFCTKPTSGLTIGLDVDMGQQNSDQDLRNNFTPDCLIARLRTFYGAKCSDPCYNPNTGVVSLILTTSEATVLSTGFVVANVKEVAPYGSHMSQNGLDVLASVAHWAGHICGYTCPSTFSQDYKLCIPYSGKMQNLVCLSVKGGIANNIQLKLALLLTQNEYKSLGYDAGVDRLGKEIQHLSGSM